MVSILPDNVNLRLCEGCAQCCKYVAVEIDEPESIEDHERILGWLLHDNVKVFVEDDEEDEDENQWFLEFRTRCGALQDNLLCGTYTTRPNLCREYSPKDCPPNNPDGDGENFVFWTPEDYLAYLRITSFSKKIDIPDNLSPIVICEIDTPTDNGDYDYISWYLLHNDVEVYKDRRGGWFIQFSTSPRQITHPELFSSVLIDPNKKSQVVDSAAVEKALSFSRRKQFLDYLTEQKVTYKLKQAKSDTSKPVELQAAIPIVPM